MKIAEVTVRNKTGLHARPAASFSSAAAGFQAIIKVENLDRENGEVNAKSMVRVLTLSVSQGARVRITAEGEDEDAAIAALTALVDGGFGEL